ncbi:hypothetical protein HK100_001742 [Physocladia obscura]|uniref:Uncharacterized protein n=1 Tax=Physocladia obscura TaxID=109957 RepID=A0AAD5TDC9_9FUNG|nr:hypothetical protein HK100_001742 [Physocladia obscura]
MLSSRSGIDRKLIEDTNIDIKAGPTATCDNTPKEQPSITGFKFPTGSDNKLLPVHEFPDFFDPWYGGHLMGAAWIAKMFKELNNSRKDYYDGEVQRQCSSNGIYSIDHTFGIIKGMALQNSQRVAEFVFNMSTDCKELRLNHIVPNAGHSAIDVPLSAAKATFITNGIGEPEIIYTDKCCDDEKFLLEKFPSLAS